MAEPNIRINGTRKYHFRAWRRILNFSEDQLNRPDAGAVLWKWVMDRIRTKREKVSTSIVFS